VTGDAQPREIRGVDLVHPSHYRLDTMSLEIPDNAVTPAQLIEFANSVIERFGPRAVIILHEYALRVVKIDASEKGAYPKNGLASTWCTP